MTVVREPVYTESEDLSFWFDGLVDNIRIDQAIIESGSASQELKDSYYAFFNSDHEALAQKARELGTKFLIKKVLDTYIGQIIKRNALPNELALELSDAKMLVWAQIDDDDENTESQLILAEAYTNAEFASKGFHVSTMIVEKSDQLPIPGHYHKVKIQKSI